MKIIFNVVFDNWQFMLNFLGADEEREGEEEAEMDTDAENWGD